MVVNNDTQELECSLAHLVTRTFLSLVTWFSGVMSVYINPFIFQCKFFEHMNTLTEPQTSYQFRKLDIDVIHLSNPHLNSGFVN